MNARAKDALHALDLTGTGLVFINNGDGSLTVQAHSNGRMIFTTQLGAREVANVCQSPTEKWLATTPQWFQDALAEARAREGI